MALINALLRYKDHGLVERFNMLGDEKAEIRLVNGRTVIVFMSDDYIVGHTSVAEAFQNEPKVDFIIHNSWNQVTESAYVLAKKHNTPIVSYGRFRYVLENMIV